MALPTTMWHALIRTHHITSRKKVSKLRTAASHHAVYALLRSGGCPGIMYCEGSESGVKDWVAAVQRLRYKDFQLAVKPVQINVPPAGAGKAHERMAAGDWGKLEEIESVKEFGGRMERIGLWEWWRRGMGYLND